jgi:hypothetical protein
MFGRFIGSSSLLGWPCWTSLLLTVVSKTASPETLPVLDQRRIEWQDRQAGHRLVVVARLSDLVCFRGH